MTEEKSSGIAVILSFFIPGLGQIYVGKIGLGILFIVLEVIFGFLSIILIGIPFAIGLWVYSMYDAYKTAEATHNRQGERTKASSGSNAAIRALKNRYASGKITKKQYMQMKEDLEE